MYAEEIFVTFPWWLKNVKSRSKIALFFKWVPFWNLISKKRKQLSFSEVNYQDYTKNDPILHVATTFSLKQGETRTSHGPIPHPLLRIYRVLFSQNLTLMKYCKNVIPNRIVKESIFFFKMFDFDPYVQSIKTVWSQKSKSKTKQTYKKPSTYFVFSSPQLHATLYLCGSSRFLHMSFIR